LIELAFQSPRITSVRSSARHENQVSRKIDITRVLDGTTKTFWHPLESFNIPRHIDSISGVNIDVSNVSVYITLLIINVINLPLPVARYFHFRIILITLEYFSYCWMESKSTLIAYSHFTLIII